MKAAPWLVLFVLAAVHAGAQEREESTRAVSAPSRPVTAQPQPATAYVPVTASERVDYIVAGTIGPRSLGVGVLAAALQTKFDAPGEWNRTWSGFGKRYAHREADVAISNAIEAGLGAIWGEDPRYIPSGRKGVWPRARYAMKTVLLAQREDGHLAPAWGRYAGNVANNVIENTWLPPSATTWEQTTLRSVAGLLSRLAGNLWEEFWPDARRRLKKTVDGRR